MPKKKEVLYDAQGRYKGEREVGQDEDLVVKGKVQDASRLNAGARQAAVTDDRPRAENYKNDLEGLKEAWRKYRAKPKK